MSHLEEEVDPVRNALAVKNLELSSISARVSSLKGDIRQIQNMGEETRVSELESLEIQLREAEKQMETSQRDKNILQNKLKDLEDQTKARESEFLVQDERLHEDQSSDTISNMVRVSAHSRNFLQNCLVRLFIT